MLCFLQLAHLSSCPPLQQASESSDEEQHPVERRPRRKMSSSREKVDAEVHPDTDSPVVETPTSAWRSPQEELNTPSQGPTETQQPRRFRLPTEGTCHIPVLHNVCICT